MNRNLPLLGMALAVAFTCTNCKNNMKINTKPYPQTRMDSSVVDNYHGTAVADPYRWLEDDRSDETAAWVKAENEVTNDFLAQIPYREQIRTRLTKLYNYARCGIPAKEGDYFFFSENDGLKNQSVIYYSKGLSGKKEVFLDPNTLSTDGTVALGGTDFSKDHKYMAYTLNASGSDWAEIHVMDVATRTKLPDVIQWVKFSNAEWSGDGFYYSSYDAPKEGSLFSGKNEYQKVYYHKLGTKQAADKLVYQDPKHPLRYFGATASEDGRFLFVNASEGTSGSEILYKDLNRGGDFKVLLKGFKNDYAIVDCKNGKLLVYSNEGAPNYRLVEIDLTSPALTQRDLIPENENLLQGVTLVGGNLFASYLKDAATKVYQLTPQGAVIREVEFPAIGTAGGFSGDKDDSLTFYSFTSFNYPNTIFSYEIASGKSEIYYQPTVDFNPENFTVEQIFYESKDGTKVPMFVVHKKGLKKNGQNPTHLYAYGGFNISYGPSFNVSNILFMEQGGIYVLANIRGGGEYGEKWHRAGMLENKQNVFDDFIAAAEYLLENKYTSPEKLAISGGSNGGLLVGACMTQRPDLYAVAFPRVGVLDMLRYHKFTIGWGWMVEYGSSDVAEQFPYIYKYSPLHNIKDGTCYPATMIMTGDHDDRVVPAHSFKFGARLQAAQGCDRPILIRIDSNAGHGAGKPISKTIDEQTDMLSFMLWNTGANVKF